MLGVGARGAAAPAGAPPADGVPEAVPEILDTAALDEALIEPPRALSAGVPQPPPLPPPLPPGVGRAGPPPLPVQSAPRPPGKPGVPAAPPPPLATAASGPARAPSGPAKAPSAPATTPSGPATAPPAPAKAPPAPPRAAAQVTPPPAATAEDAPPLPPPPAPPPPVAPPAVAAPPPPAAPPAAVAAPPPAAAPPAAAPAAADARTVLDATPPVMGRQRTITRDLEALLAEAPPRRARPAELVQSLAERGQAVARTAVSGARDAVRSSSEFARNLLDAARTVVVALRENLQRRRQIATRLEELAAEKERLTAALGDLGRAVRASGVAHPALAEELGAIAGIEARIAETASARDQIAVRRTTAANEFDDRDAENAALQEAREDALRRASGELQAKESERSGGRDRLARIEGELKSLSHEVGAREAEILKAESADAQADLRREAERLRTRGAALEPERDEAGARLAVLDHEVAELEAQVAKARERVEEARRARTQAAGAQQRLLADVDAEAERREAEIGLYDREIARRCVTLGNLCQRERDDLPQFAGAYRDVDTLSDRINEQLDAIGALREAIHTSTAPPFKTGLVVLGSAGLVVVLLVVLLLRLLLR